METWWHALIGSRSKSCFIGLSIRKVLFPENWGGEDLNHITIYSFTYKENKLKRKKKKCKYQSSSPLKASFSTGSDQIKFI